MAAAFFISGELVNYPYLIRVAELLPFLYPPLIYAYTLSMIYQYRWLQKKYLLLLLPFLLAVIVLIPFYSKSGSDKIIVYQQMLLGNYPADFFVMFALKSFFGIVILILSLYNVHKSTQATKRIFSATEGKQLYWLRYILIGFIFLWLMATIRFVFGYTQLSVYVPAIFVALLIYLLSYFTLRQNELFNKVEIETLAELEEPVEISDKSTGDGQEIIRTVTKNEYDTKSNTEGKSCTDKENAEKIFQHLLKTITEQQAFLDKNITLPQVAILTGIRANLISEILNKCYSTNFYDFINDLRAKEVVSRLENGAFSHLTIDALAEECGFKSKSTFYQSFKKLTGTTPFQYKKGLSAP